MLCVATQLRAHVLDVVAYLRACVLGVFACLVSLRAWRSHVFDVLACSRAWRAFVFACFAYVLSMMRAWRA